MSKQEPEVYERNGQWYRRLAVGEVVRLSDMVALSSGIEMDKQWLAFERLVRQEKRYKRRMVQKVDAFAYLRPCDPLTFVMLRALQRRSNK